MSFYTSINEGQNNIIRNNIHLGINPKYSLSKNPIERIIKDINHSNGIYFNNNKSETNYTNKYSNFDLPQKALEGQLEQTPLSNNFFSERNFKNINDTVRYEVFKQTTHVISDVSMYELSNIMRSIFLNWANFLNCDLKKQIEILNTKVVDYCVELIVSEVNTYINYIKGISTNNLNIMNYPEWMGRDNYTFDMTNIPT